MNIEMNKKIRLRRNGKTISTYTRPSEAFFWRLYYFSEKDRIGLEILINEKPLNPIEMTVVWAFMEIFKAQKNNYKKLPDSTNHLPNGVIK